MMQLEFDERQTRIINSYCALKGIGKKQAVLSIIDLFGVNYLDDILKEIREKSKVRE